MADPDAAAGSGDGGAAASAEEHRRLFMIEIDAYTAERDTGRSQFLTPQHHANICTACRAVQWEQQVPGSLRSRPGFWQIHDWIKKYELLRVGDEEVLVFKAEPGTPLDQRKLVTHAGRCFDDLLPLHVGVGGHSKDKALKHAVVARFGKSVPQWVPDLLCKTCPICVQVPQVFFCSDCLCAASPDFDLLFLCMQADAARPESAGHKPILTKGFGARGQVCLPTVCATASGRRKNLRSTQRRSYLSTGGLD